MICNPKASGLEEAEAAMVVLSLLTLGIFLDKTEVVGLRREMVAVLEEYLSRCLVEAVEVELNSTRTLEQVCESPCYIV